MAEKNNEEVMKILELLEKGVINVGETKELLGTISDMKSKKSIDFDVEKVQKSAEKLAKELGGKFDDVKTKVTPKLKETFDNLSKELEKVSEKINSKLSKDDECCCGNDCCCDCDDEDFDDEDFDDEFDELVELEKIEEAIEEFEAELESLEEPEEEK
ncbi:MAG: hypothetical protein ACK5LY_00140 [Lachnospirales bacterium]